MAGETFPEQDALEVRMAFKGDTHQIVDFALLEISPPPDGRDRSHLGVPFVLQVNLQHEGETTWYTPMSCEKVKLNMPNLCKPDKTCKGITNPLSYYNRKMREK